MSNQKLKQIALFLILSLGLILIALAILVRYHNVLGTDVFLSRDLQSGGNDPVRKTLIYDLLYGVSLFGKPVIAAIMVGLISLLFWAYKYYRETIYILLTPVASLVNSAVKIIVGRPRPPANLVDVLAIETDKSFPSGHVNFYTVFFGLLFVLLFFTPKIPKFARYSLQMISIFLMTSVSFSRVYLGVHWATDTVGGYLLGSVILCFFLYFYLKQKVND